MVTFRIILSRSAVVLAPSGQLLHSVCHHFCEHYVSREGYTGCVRQKISPLIGSNKWYTGPTLKFYRLKGIKRPAAFVIVCFCEFRIVRYSGSCGEQVVDFTQSMLVFVLSLKAELDSRLFCNLALRLCSCGRLYRPNH